MDPIVRRLRESRSQETDQYKKKVEDILNNQLFGDELYVRVTDLEIVSETPTKITFKVDYTVTISIPYYDEEADREYAETEEEYRTRSLTLDKEDLAESTSYQGYSIKWINDPQGGKHVEVYDKDKKFKASYEDEEKAKSAIDSGDVEGREDESIDTSVGSTFKNAGLSWEVLDSKGEYTLIYSATKKWHPYVVAWKLASDGSWAQGHYFADEAEARKYLSKK